MHPRTPTFKADLTSFAVAESISATIGRSGDWVASVFAIRVAMRARIASTQDESGCDYEARKRFHDSHGTTSHIEFAKHCHGAELIELI